MEKKTIRYVLVWSGWLRLCHWLLAVGVLFQIASAWAMDHDYVDPIFWQDWHILVGQFLLVVLIGRIFLLFSAGTSHWRSLVPTRAQVMASLQMIRFYLTLGRSPLPNWYAHSPFWQPLYGVFFFILLVCLVTGLMSKTSSWYLVGMPAKSIHETMAIFIVIFSVAHMMTSFFHDLRGKGAFVSAIINGHRYFHVDADSKKAEVFVKKSSAVVIPIQEIKKTQKP